MKCVTIHLGPIYDGAIKAINGTGLDEIYHVSALRSTLFYLMEQQEGTPASQEWDFNMDNVTLDIETIYNEITDVLKKTGLEEGIYHLALQRISYEHDKRRQTPKERR